MSDVKMTSVLDRPIDLKSAEQDLKYIESEYKDRTGVSRTVDEIIEEENGNGVPLFNSIRVKASFTADMFFIVSMFRHIQKCNVQGYLFSINVPVEQSVPEVDKALPLYMKDEIITSYRKSIDMYNTLRKQGYPYIRAISVLPVGMNIRFSISMGLREWRKFFSQPISDFESPLLSNFVVQTYSFFRAYYYPMFKDVILGGMA